MRQIALCIVLAGIASASVANTPEQWRQKPPRWEVTSTRSLEELQGCLGSKWAATLSLPIVSQPIEHGSTYVNSGMNRDIMVDLTDDGDHRTIKLWLRKFMGITAGAKEHIDKLSACASARR